MPLAHSDVTLITCRQFDAAKLLQSARRNRRELFWLREALVNLQEGKHPAGEAMDKAERAFPVPEHAVRDLSTNAGATVEQLRAQLDRIMKAES
jgi:hypothetical protein